MTRPFFMPPTAAMARAAAQVFHNRIFPPSMSPAQKQRIESAYNCANARRKAALSSKRPSTSEATTARKRRLKARDVVQDPRHADVVRRLQGDWAFLGHKCFRDTLPAVEIVVADVIRDDPRTLGLCEPLAGERFRVQIKANRPYEKQKETMWHEAAHVVCLVNGEFDNDVHHDSSFRVYCDHIARGMGKGEIGPCQSARDVTQWPDGSHIERPAADTEPMYGSGLPQQIGWHKCQYNAPEVTW